MEKNEVFKKFAWECWIAALESIALDGAREQGIPPMKFDRMGTDFQKNFLRLFDEWWATR